MAGAQYSGAPACKFRQMPKRLVQSGIMGQTRLACDDLFRQMIEGVSIVHGILVARHICVKAAVRRVTDAQIIPPIDGLLVQMLQLLFRWRGDV